MEREAALEGSARALRAVAMGAIAVVGLAGCAAPVVLAGTAVAGGTSLALDRRSVGMQIEDEEIEHRTDRAVYDHFKIEPVNLYVTSYDRKVLLTGQVPDQATKDECGSIASRVENTAGVVNELQVAAVSSTADRAQDSYVATKVRATLLNNPPPPFGVVKTRITAGIAYLMGRVTRGEGDEAARKVSRVDGVRGVVKVFEYVSEADIASDRPAPVVESGSSK
ncbi:MAG TPA: BON domain-containing protein [Burkholderiaceae bacterium]|nr:BON domain-containing protein [Burkholderiaceae bacterium]